jgi:SpoVK/Ycf46/Vps4 family AAA+-type ATPase
VVFIDEVDSLLSQRSSEENEASRRMKTEFLVQLDGAGTDQSARVVIIGATNRPDELDEAARRRFVKRIYIPLPDPAGRKQLLQRLLSDNLHSLTPQDVDYLANKTEGYSGADIRNLCTEAAMGPMRELALQCGNLKSIQASDVPHITMQHFKEAYDEMSPSVSQADLQRYIDWNNQFGSFRRME